MHPQSDQALTFAYDYNPRTGFRVVGRLQYVFGTDAVFFAARLDLIETGHGASDGIPAAGVSS